MSNHTDHEHPHIDNDLRARAIESLLVEKGVLFPDAVDEVVRRYERDIGPMTGARIVAHAWTDDAFKHRLLTNGNAAIGEFGLDLRAKNFVVLENTPGTRHAVVCTLCSCYPWPVLGLPPTWYKSPSYRSRMVIEPRMVLSEFGLDVDDSTQIHVWDSTADTRYMVLPERPDGTEGMAEDELALLVTRDSMIGVGDALAPTGG